MIFTETALPGAFIIDIDARHDDRGFFARLFCQRDFSARGLKPVVAQTNLAFNRVKGTVRGLHFQYPPAAETKLIRCTRGAIFDVIVDLRPESPTFLRQTAVELTAATHRALYVPERFAHGYQVLEDETEVTYQVGEFYTPEQEGGLPYNDPQFQIRWPLAVTELSPKDTRWEPFERVESTIRRRMILSHERGDADVAAAGAARDPR